MFLSDCVVNLDMNNGELDVTSVKLKLSLANNRPLSKECPVN